MLMPILSPADGPPGAPPDDVRRVDTGNRVRDRHLRSPDFLSAARHPELRYDGDDVIQIACRTRVDRIALGVRGSRGIVPPTVELDVAITLHRADGRR